MKNFIIISLAFLAFSIVNCKRSLFGIEPGLPLTKEECAKDETKQWNEDKGVCEDKQVEVMTKKECEKDETKQWNAEANEGKGMCEDKPEEKMYTITNKISDNSLANNQVSISLNDFVVIGVKDVGQSQSRKDTVFKEGMDLLFDDCLEIKESHFAKMRVFIDSLGEDDIILCDSLDAEQSDCKVGNYEAVASLPVHYGPAQPRLIPSSKNEKDCKGSMNLKEK